jgi:hypothetical protein
MRFREEFINLRCKNGTFIKKEDDGEKLYNVKMELKFLNYVGKERISGLAIMFTSGTLRAVKIRNSHICFGRIDNL